jgi:hypothetical protein
VNQESLGRAKTTTIFDLGSFQDHHYELSKDCCQDAYIEDESDPCSEDKGSECNSEAFNAAIAVLEF